MKKIVKLQQYCMAYLQRVRREKVGLWPSMLVRVVSAASLAWGGNLHTRCNSVSVGVLHLAKQEIFRLRASV